MRGERSELDKRLELALATLAGLAIWELEATTAVLDKRSDGVGVFARVFREVADARAGGYSTGGAGWTLKAAIRAMDDEDADRLNGAAAPFWALVLEACEGLDEDS